MPLHPPPRPRSRAIALLTAGTFLLCFMPRPLDVENVPVDQIDIRTAEGLPALPAAPD